MINLAIVLIILMPNLPKEKLSLEKDPIAFIAAMKVEEKPWLTLHKIESNMAQEKYEKWLKENACRLKKLLLERYPEAKDLGEWHTDLDKDGKFKHDVNLADHNLSACLYHFFVKKTKKNLDWE